jgi:hypothetical protein
MILLSSLSERDTSQELRHRDILSRTVTHKDRGSFCGKEEYLTAHAGQGDDAH